MFCRRFRLIEYSTDNCYTESNLDPSLVRNPSKFNPLAHRDSILDIFVDHLTKYTLEEITDVKKSKANLIWEKNGILYSFLRKITISL